MCDKIDQIFLSQIGYNAKKVHPHITPTQIGAIGGWVLFAECDLGEIQN